MEGHTGQLVMREIVEDYLTYVTWADDGYPSMLELRNCQPPKVVMDPAVLSGSRFSPGAGPGCVMSRTC